MLERVGKEEIARYVKRLVPQIVKPRVNLEKSVKKKKKTKNIFKNG